MDNKRRNIVAAAVLSSIAEAKAFNLKNSLAELLNEDVHRINDLIRSKTGIDLLDTNSSIGPKQLEQYEGALDDFIQSNLKNNIDEGTIAEEVKLIESTFDYSIGDFKSFPLRDDFSSKGVKKIFKEIGLSAPSVIPIAKNPIRVQVMKGLFDEFLAVSKFESRSKNIYVLFHLGTAPSAQTSKFGFAHLDEQVKKGNYEDGGVLHATNCFFFTEETAHNTEPVFLFLKALNKYGKHITIDSVTKKFFFKGYTSELLIHRNDIKITNKIVGTGGGIVAGYVAAKRTFTGFEYGNAYTIDIDRMLSDYRSRKFQ